MSISAQKARERIDGILEPYLGGEKPDYILIDNPLHGGPGIIFGNEKHYRQAKKVEKRVLAVVDECFG